MAFRDTTTQPLELIEQAGCIFAGLDESGCIAWINGFGRRLLGSTAVDTPLIDGLVKDAENPGVDLAHLAHSILREPAACSPSVLVVRGRDNRPLRIRWRFSRCPIFETGSSGILAVGMPAGPFITYGDRQAKGERTGDACVPSQPTTSSPFVLTDDHLQRYLEEGPRVCSIVDLKGRILYANDQMADITGYTRKELQRLTIFDLRPPDTHADIKHEIERQVDQYRKTGTTAAFKYDVKEQRMKILARNGDQRTMMPAQSTQVLEDVSGRPAALLVSGIDITELVAATAALRENEARYRFFFDHTPVLNAVIDFDGRLMDINEATAQFFGVERESVLGRSYFDLYTWSDPEQRERLDTIRKKTYAKMRAYVKQHPDALMVDPESPTQVTIDSPALGERFLYRPTNYPIVHENGRPVGFISTYVDITDLEKTRRELAKHRENLEALVAARTEELKAAQAELVKQERLAALGHLTATVSHELRNPLGTVSSSLYVIDKRTRGHVEGIETALERARRSIRRCDGIIEELLNYTREQALTLEPTDLDAWLSDFLDEQSIPADVTLTRKLAAGTRVAMDHEAFRRLMVNLVDNALQAVAEGRSQRQVSIGTSRDETHAVIRIADTGPGMDEERLSHIFEPLFSTKTFGVGLGLPIVRKIARQHGGDIHIESRPGEGTAAVVSIPRWTERERKR